MDEDFKSAGYPVPPSAKVLAVTQTSNLPVQATSVDQKWGVSALQAVVKDFARDKALRGWAIGDGILRSQVHYE